jgi:dTDP-4-amino-4,6-dideoxygalactose transaminase
MQIPLVDLKAQYTKLKPEMDAAIQRVLNHANFVLGQEVADFERAFADYIKSPEAVGVASGTAALHLALLVCGIGVGNEVITTAHTFFATAEIISQTGAKPVFVDIHPQTYNLDPNLVEAAITPRTRAILPVHLYGQPADMGPLLDIAQRHNLWLIEDAAQAHGAMYQDKYCGNLGHLACFSFYPGKNLGGYGDGGLLTGTDEQLLAKVRKLRNHGRTTKYEHDELGWGERLDALQAAILAVKLPYLEAWTTARRKRAAYYNQLLSQVEIILPWEMPGVRHVYHLYVIRTKQRDKMLAFLKARGIGAGVHYPIPMHRQPVYLKQGYDETHLPVTETVAAEVLSLPLYPELTDQKLEYVAAAVEEFATHG